MGTANAGTHVFFRFYAEDRHGYLDSKCSLRSTGVYSNM